MRSGNLRAVKSYFLLLYTAYFNFAKNLKCCNSWLIFLNGKVRNLFSLIYDTVNGAYPFFKIPTLSFAFFEKLMSSGLGEAEIHRGQDTAFHE